MTAEELRALVALGGSRPIHIHAAEQVREVEDCIAATGARPVEWLLDNAPLDARWCVIHATHLTPTETGRLAETGATVGLCPLTEANLGDGIFPAAEFVAHGGHYGIGTDSNVRIDAAGELCQLEYTQRLTRRARNVLASGEGSSTGRSLFDAALVGGNRALGRVGGGLAVGAPADVVTLNRECEDLAARERGDTVLDRLIFAGGKNGAIQDVWARGVRVVADGRHRAREAVRPGFRRALKRILSD